MVRQCAWCLRLIDGAGERISPTPLPKLYEASHGICSVCGMLWIAQAGDSSEIQAIQNMQAAQKAMMQKDESERIPPMVTPVCGIPATNERAESITQFVLQLQQKPAREKRSGRNLPSSTNLTDNNTPSAISGRKKGQIKIS